MADDDKLELDFTSMQKTDMEPWWVHLIVVGLCLWATYWLIFVGK